VEKTAKGLRNRPEVAEFRPRETDRPRERSGCGCRKEGGREGRGSWRGREGEWKGRERRENEICFLIFFPFFFGARLVVVCSFAQGKRVRRLLKTVRRQLE
jgi:hypothetical protein